MGCSTLAAERLEATLELDWFVFDRCTSQACVFIDNIHLFVYAFKL